jgi:hypothetical protein
VSLVALVAAVSGSGAPSASLAHAAHETSGRSAATAETANGGFLEIDAVSAVSTTDAWAVGRKVQFGGADWSQVILHWDGMAWSRVLSPHPGKRAQLSGVDAISPDDAWAVGSHEISGVEETLIEHWDGSRWSVVPGPSPGLTQSWLTSVSVVSPGAAMAVGGYVVYQGVQRRVHTLIVQWNGTDWSLAPSPNPGVRSNVLLSVAADSSRDAWAVGSYTPTLRSGHRATLALHWDGATWSQVETPNPGGRQDTFSGVAATSSRHAWAVGAYRAEGKGRQTLIARWNGSAWSQVWSPNPGPTENQLDSVSALSPTDVWAVGEFVATKGTGGAPYRTLIVHLGQSGWTQVPGPKPGDGFLTSVSADSATDAWASGYVAGRFLRWNGTRWTKAKPPEPQIVRARPGTPPARH